MPAPDLTPEEHEELKDIIDDLESVFQKERINVDEIDELVNQLKSNRVKQYLKDLQRGSKPESALREELIAGSSPLAAYFFGDDFSPESSISEGFVDYQIEDTPPILLELKAPITPVYNSEGNLKYLKNKELDWKEHKEQIDKYQMENEYLILTDLNKWEFFSRYTNENKPMNSNTYSTREFYKDISRSNILSDYLDRVQGETRRGDLDEEFFDSLKRWVSALENVEFEQDISDDKETEYVLNLINKFIFIQTLDSYSVIDFRWIEDSWEENERKWSNLGEEEFLSRFLGEVTDWFHAYYDTELFKGTILDHVDDSPENLKVLKSSLKKVLGLEDYQHQNISPGVTNYNFREIDEDIFGKAYETYLAEIRKEQGIYYTPKYITEYIVEDTVGEKFGDKAEEIEEAVKEEEFDKAKREINKFKNLTVLDPACGSGSFLIKSLRSIWTEYNHLLDTIRSKQAEHEELVEGKLQRTDEDERLYRAAKELEEELNFANERELISKIILRHIHGNDLDNRALEVAKLNIWLEAIKLTPDQFYYQNIPEGEGYVLPDLEWNLSHGNSLVGFSVDEALDRLESDHNAMLKNLNESHSQYLNDPTDESAVRSGADLLTELKEKLDSKYKTYLRNNNVDINPSDTTTPFHWGLQFWEIFQNRDGFDIVIGNPPYVGEKERKERFEVLKETSIVRECYQGRMDMLYFFVLLGVKLTNDSGISSMITTAYWPEADSAENLRNEILQRTSVEELLGFNGYTVFEEAPGQENLIYKFDNAGQSEITFSYIRSSKYEKEKVDQSLLSDKDVFYQNTYDDFELPTGGDEWYGIKGLSKGSLDLPEVGRSLSDVLSSKQGIVPNPDSVSKRSYEDFNNDNLEIGEGVFLLEPDDLDRIGIDSSHSLLEPAYRNSNIKQFYIDYPDDLYVLYVTSDVDIDQYPQIKKHLERYRDKLEDRREVKQNKISWYSLQWPRNRELFETPKIVYSNWGNDWQPYAVEDKGYYERRDITLLKPNNSELDLHQLTAILNSSLSRYWQTEKRSRTGYTTQGSLDDLPIPNNLSEDLGESARELRAKIGSRYSLKAEILRASEQLKTQDRSLSTILGNDRQKRQAGQGNQTWSEQVSFYPSQDKEVLTEEYEEFVIDVSGTELTIIALDGQKETSIYNIEFQSDELSQIIYISIEELLESRSHVNSLEDILEKTKIPIIGGGTAQKTTNIVDTAVSQWKNKLDSPTNITEIDKEIKNQQAEVDAIVFRLYELDQSDTETILDGIEVRNSYKQSVLDRI